MALHFACLDSNNVIKNLVTVEDSAVSFEGDPAGETYCQNLFGTGPNGDWVSYKQTQKTRPYTFRYNGARKGGTYDPVNDAFIPERQYSLFVLDENFRWQPPINYPTVGRNGVEGFVNSEDGIEWSDSEATWLNIAEGLPNLKWDDSTLTWGNL